MTIRVWTIQPLAVWEQALREGEAFVEPAAYREGYIPWQYRWLAEQLKRRLPGYRGDLPWWAYGSKPDLRWVRHRRPAGQREVRLELELSAGEAVAFPCWAWDTVYGGQYFSLERRERREWTAALKRAVPDYLDLWPLPEPWQAELEASWERLFDPALPARPWKGYRGIGAKGEREAVFGCLRPEAVRGVTHFVGNSRWR